MGVHLSKEGSLKSEESESPYLKRILEAREKLTGMERLKLVFTVDQYGDVSPEITRVIHGTLLGLFLGAFFGGISRGRIALANFLRSNAHERFSTSLEAKMVSTAVSTYRGKMGVLDQVAGAGMAGFLCKVPQGPKAMFSGGVVGSGLGLCAGMITLSITRLTGTTIDSANMHYYLTMAKKDEKSQASLQQSRELKHEFDRDWDDDGTSGLTILHDKLLADSKLEEEFKNSSQVKEDNKVQVSSESKSDVVNKSSGPAASTVTAAASSSKTT